MDLITAGRAIQYFDTDKFFLECQRILKPNAVVAFYSSDHTRFAIPEEPNKADQLNARFRKVNVFLGFDILYVCSMYYIFNLAEGNRHQRLLGRSNRHQTKEIRRHQSSIS